MSGNIYLLQPGEDLRELTEAPYDSEALLQRLLARYPQLLAGDQVDTNQPRRWLLVRREMPVPDTEEGAGRWALDHLFLDQDGIPTLIEVKRSTDTRLRREVVGQMLDYAANAVVHWPLERIRAAFEMTCERNERNPDEVLTTFLSSEDADSNEVDTEGFWQDVQTNLQAGRVRMVFVADIIPPELQRIVEFLNEQMNPAEVLALEVRQYVGENLQTLVPRVLGQTAAAQQKKSTRSSPVTAEVTAFWEALLTYAAPRSPFYRDVKPGREYAQRVGIPAPKGVNFLHRTSRNQMTARCHIRLDRDPEGSRRLYEAFWDRKEEIERAFGEALEWEQRSVGAHIMKAITVGGYADPDRWEAVFEEAVDTMTRLGQALRPVMDRLDAESTGPG